MDSQIGLIVVECGPIKSTNIEIKNQENFDKLGDLAVGKGENQKKGLQRVLGEQYVVKALTLPRQYLSSAIAGENFSGGPKLHSRRGPD